MRNSKSRSRSKPNRNRPAGGNVVNRVFDSSGPEGKVRGTPQQIIDKYSQLARDAQLSNDRVAFENFQQHAEHYTRLLSEAQREMDARREHQERERERQQQNQQQRREEAAAKSDEQPSVQPAPQPTAQPAVQPAPSSDGVIDAGEAGATLVDTPEGGGNKPRRPRRRRNTNEEAKPAPQDAPDAAKAPAEKAPAEKAAPVAAAEPSESPEAAE